MRITRKTVALPVILLAATVALSGCTPQAGGKCDPSKDSSYLSSHTENGRTKTTKLECRQVGINKYRWVKV